MPSPPPVASVSKPKANYPKLLSQPSWLEKLARKQLQNQIAKLTKIQLSLKERLEEPEVKNTDLSTLFHEDTTSDETLTFDSSNRKEFFEKERRKKAEARLKKTLAQLKTSEEFLKSLEKLPEKRTRKATARWYSEKDFTK